ncbi:dTDP-4-dehydrorhamnose 3,5-epimerase [Leptospira wolbachii]
MTNIEVTPLKNIQTAGGNVMHGLRSSDKSFSGFGEAYFSWVDAGAIKAWKRHNKMIMNLIVPVGDVKFVFYDSHSDQFLVHVIGESNYSRITVPTGIWFGFQGLGTTKNLVLDIASIEHDPLETDRLDLTEIKYNWTEM